MRLRHPFGAPFFDSLFEVSGLRGYLTDWGLQQIVRRNMRNAGFLPPKTGPHTLRHTFGTQYILKRGDVFSSHHGTEET